MKKKIALLLAAVMTVGSLPMTAFASTTNTVSSIKTVEDGDDITAKVFLDEFKGVGSVAKKQTIKLTLNNAKFKDAQATAGDAAELEAAKAELEAAKADLTKAQDSLAQAKAARDAKLEELLGAEAAEELATAQENVATAEKAVEDATAAKTEADDALTAATKADDAAQAVKTEKGEAVKTAYAALYDAKTDATLKFGSATVGSSDDKATILSTVDADISSDFSYEPGLSTDTEGTLDEELDALNATLPAYRGAFANAEETEAAKDEAQTAADNAATALSKEEGKLTLAQEALTKAEEAVETAKEDETYKALEKAVTDAEAEVTKAEAAVEAAQDKVDDLENGTSTFANTTISGSSVTYTKISDTEYMAEFEAADDDKVELNILAEADGSGDATITIESVDSVVSSQTLKIANIADGATTTTISGTTSIKETATKIKSIVITETTAGSIDENGRIKLKLTNGFKWMNESQTSVVVFPSNNGITAANFEIDDEDSSVAYIQLTGQSTTTAATISLQNAYVAYDEDDAEIGDECEVTVSDDGVSKQSVVIGTASDYAVNFTVEDKDLPTFYAGRYDDDTESLVVTIKENIENSWLTDRKTKIVFPEGVEVMAVTEDDKDKINSWDYTIDENEVTLDVTKASTGKAELDLKFELSVSPDFTGDIDATLTGSGVGDDQSVSVGTAAFPVTVDADINELKIDYRNTEASDIVITEADAGVLEKGDTVYLQIDNIDFDGDPTVEVESGDMKIENVKVNKGTLSFKIKTASQKEAAVIRVSDVNLYMERSLPAGEYDLKVIANDEATVTTGGNFAGESLYTQADDAIIKNYSDANDDATGTFDVDEVVVKEGYVTVVTAGRDQDDSTFTTKVTVTIGSDTMYAGTTEIKLDVPAYISNGYTMMPVRAVTEALSGSAIVRWDDPTKTVTITFGQRVISMTVGSNVMKINGVDVAMQAQCEITGERAFIPLRDLGYALGLNDSKIGWDDATKTATLN